MLYSPRSIHYLLFLEKQFQFRSSFTTCHFKILFSYTFFHFFKAMETFRRLEMLELPLTEQTLLRQITKSTILFNSETIKKKNFNASWLKKVQSGLHNILLVVMKQYISTFQWPFQKIFSDWSQRATLKYNYQNSH